MDVSEVLQKLHKKSAVDTIRRPVVTAEKINGTATSRRSRTKEVGSSYRSPTPTNSRRCPSPNLTRNVDSTLPLSGPKQAVSAERKRPSAPSSPLPPLTPVADTAAESQTLVKKMSGSRLPEVLWPSTMRSLSVSFQSDSISIPVVKKKERKKSVTNGSSDRTLKPSCNVASQKQVETNASCRKLTPERKRSPLKGNNSFHQSENLKPVDSSQSKLIDQHRWPSRIGGRLSSNIMTRSVDLADRTGKISSSLIPGRLSADGLPRPLHTTSSDSSDESEFDDHIDALGLRMESVDDSLLRVSARHTAASGLSLSDNSRSDVPASLFRSGSVSGSRLPSPSRVSISRALASPSKTRSSTPVASRGASPSRIRPSSPTRQSTSMTSVLSFIAVNKKGKNNNQLEEAHRLRLLYNRHLQWRFANARAKTALYIQKITSEQTLYNVWQANLELWDSVIRKRIDLQWLNLELKLNSVLSEQMAYLDDWALLEKDHHTSLNGATKDLEACTLRLPITDGAKANIDSLIAAISSSVGVMQTMGSSIYSLLSKVEEMNGLVSDLSELAGKEKVMLNECEALLGSTSVMQVKENSLKTNFIQLQEVCDKTRHPLLWAI